MKCIYHIPIPLDPNAKSASGIRPQKMLQAFKDIGYDVIVVSGYARERKKAFDEIKRQVANGEKFEFLYSESSTMPTILTEPNHMPTHPFVDFALFRFCKKHGIKIGLFYRDIYWKFDIYREKISRLKYLVAILAYKYDLLQYGFTLEKLYVPSKRVYDYLKNKKLQDKLDTLPPGCDECNVPKNLVEMKRDFFIDPLHIFYVGGLGGHYQIAELLRAVSELDYCEITVCCRKCDWEKSLDQLGHFSKYSNIHIVYESGKGLERYYSKADVCALLFEPNEYMKLAIPYKAFEYLAWGKPMLVSRGTAIGDFVASHGIGWVIEYSKDRIKESIYEILSEPSELYPKKAQCVIAQKENRWVNRAQKVIKDLTGEK